MLRLVGARTAARRYPKFGKLRRGDCIRPREADRIDRAGRKCYRWVAGGDGMDRPLMEREVILGRSCGVLGPKLDC